MDSGNMVRHSDVLQIAWAKQAEPLLFLFNPAVHAGASDVTPSRTCCGISICNRSAHARRDPPGIDATCVAAFSDSLGMASVTRGPTSILSRVKQVQRPRQFAGYQLLQVTKRNSRRYRLGEWFSETSSTAATGLPGRPIQHIPLVEKRRSE